MKKLIYVVGGCFVYSVVGCASMRGSLPGVKVSSAKESTTTQSAKAQAEPASDVVSRPNAGSNDSSSNRPAILQSECAGDGKINETVAFQPGSTLSVGSIQTVSAVEETSQLKIESLSYTLADIEAIALENNPALALAKATTTKAAGLRHQVGLRPNPTLGYFGQQIADRGTDQHGVFVEQEFVRGDKLQLNRDAIGHTQRAQVAEAEAQLYRVLTDVRVRFYEAVAAQQQYDATQAFADIARRGVQVAQDRQKAAEGTLIETLQAETLLSEVTLAAEQTEVAYTGAWQDLAAIAGLKQTTPMRLVGDLNGSALTPDWQVAYANILAHSPELAVAQAIVCEKQALLRRQQAQPIPNVTGQLGAGYDDGTDNGMINVQLSAPIPVWNQNSGNISAAYQDYVRATQEVKRVEQSIQSRLAREAQDFESAMKAVRKYQDEIIPQVNRSLELSEEAYRAGELDFLQVLIVRRSFYESSIRLIEAQGRLAQSTARVDGLLLTGGLESPRDFTDGDAIRGVTFSGQ
ncbi:MAG TPA: TolC family protein [Planctomycetaceae bacterium]|nr:TolC family protein [Planctomycetaceae bacterium]